MKTAFFEQFFSDGEIINIREIGKDKTKNLFFRLSDLKEYDPLDNEDIYFGVFTRTEASGKAAACGVTRAIWCDYDNMTLASVKGAMLDSGAPTPSIYINSGHGIHAYWILKDPATPSEAIPIVKGLASATGADPKATDTARIMRVPGTFNNKGERVACRIIEENDNRYEIGAFEAFRTAYKPQHNVVQPVVIPELDNCKWPCIKNMACGVHEGERNFALGRLTKHLQQRGHAKKDATKIILQWNTRNNPPEDSNKLIRDMYSYWHADYKLLGCDLEDIGLQSILNQYCDRATCPHKAKKNSRVLDQGVAFNNRLLNEIHNFTGNELVLYGVLGSTPRGLTISQALEKLTRRKGKTPCMIDDTFRKCIKTLQALGFVEVSERGKKSGHENIYRVKPQGTYGLGYTIVSTLAINGVIDGRITPAELKVYIQLLRYAYGKGEAWPSVKTLSRDLQVSRPHITRCIRELEQRDYLYKSYDIKKGVRCLNYRIRV